MRWCVLTCALGSAAMAEDLPDFATCMDGEAARFERTLSGVRGAQDVSGFDVGDVRGVGYCGSVGIVLCDRSPDPFGCQRALRVEQDVLTARVLSSLPAPETVEGDEAAVYATVWAFAQGSSAGPDCAGDIPVRQVWCEAWEANNRLSNAVLAWQWARYLSAAEDAVTAGWARALHPVRPQTPVRP